MRLAKGLKVVFFDLHGTLAYSTLGVDLVDVISSLLLSLGVKAYTQRVRAALSYVLFIDYSARRFKTYEGFLRQLLLRLESSLPEDRFARLSRELKAYVLDSYSLYPDTASTLRNIYERGYSIGVITTTPEFMFKNAIREVRKYIGLIVTGYEAMCDKSNPDIYLYALRSLEVSPEEALMVGDDIYLDVTIPRQLGMHAVLLRRDRGGSSPPGVTVIRSLGELLEIIE